MTTAIYDIPEANLGWIREKVAKLNKRAEKLGVTGIEFNVLSEEVRDYVRMENGLVLAPPKTQSFDARISIKFVKVAIIGDAPVLNGWKFVGTLQHVEENGTVSVTILRAVPGEQIPETYRDAPNWCDQCRMNRVRNDTFIVKNVQPSINMDVPVIFKQVGRNCLEDFLGHTNPHKLADWAEELTLFADLMRGAQDDIPYGRRNDRIFRLRDVVVLSAQAVRQFGFVSKRAQREAEERGDEIPTSTADRVMDEFMGDGDLGGVAPETIALAEQAAEWALTELQSKAREPNANDYIYNLAQVMKLSYIDFRMMGIAVSLIFAYQREMSKRAGNEERVSRSNYFGTPGVRGVFTLTVRAVRGVHLANGDSCNVIEFEDVDGNEAVWFTSGTMDLGVTYRVKATIKRHDEFRGVKQTVLNRVQKVA